MYLNLEKWAHKKIWVNTKNVQAVTLRTVENPQTPEQKKKGIKEIEWYVDIVLQLVIPVKVNSEVEGLQLVEEFTGIKEVLN